MVSVDSDHNIMGKLPKFIRFVIFNFLTVKETLKVAMTNKQVRSDLERSEIAKAGKEMKIRIEDLYYKFPQ